MKSQEQWVQNRASDLVPGTVGARAGQSRSAHSVLEGRVPMWGINCSPATQTLLWPGAVPSRAEAVPRSCHSLGPWGDGKWAAVCISLGFRKAGGLKIDLGALSI